MLRPLSQGEYDRLDDTGFNLARYGNASERIALCTYCGPGNSKVGVIISAVMVALGLALYPMCLRLRREHLHQ